MRMKLETSTNAQKFWTKLCSRFLIHFSQISVLNQWKKFYIVFSTILSSMFCRLSFEAHSWLISLVPSLSLSLCFSLCVARVHRYASKKPSRQRTHIPNSQRPIPPWRALCTTARCAWRCVFAALADVTHHKPHRGTREIENVYEDRTMSKRYEEGAFLCANSFRKPKLFNAFHWFLNELETKKQKKSREKLKLLQK